MEANTQASTSETIKKTWGGRKGKTPQQQADTRTIDETEAINDDIDDEPDSDSDVNDGGKRYNFHTLLKLLEPVSKLMSLNYYSWSAHVRSFL
ncbi:hypothetical protein NDA18_002014 [Ustilago nuda]|nr:hypothetical protein NDA18_002014 [Ustilago nuda]